MAGNLLTVRRKLPRWIYLLAVTAKRVMKFGLKVSLPVHNLQLMCIIVATATPLQQLFGSISVDAVSQDSQRYHVVKHAS